jgi:hypothetical protein
VTAATDRHATIEELLEAVFSVGSFHRLYQESLLARASSKFTEQKKFR